MKASVEGLTGVMITLNRVSDNPYVCETGTYDIHAIANLEEMVPADFISEDGCQITDKFVNYIRPLVQGELYPIFKNGLPYHLVRK